MAIDNSSFEDEGTPLGVPDGWLVADFTAHVEVAEFGPLLGFERFERDWRLPFGLSLVSGDLVNHTLWYGITGGVDPLNVEVPGSAPAADYVVHTAVYVMSGIIPGGGVLVTIGYTNELGDTGRTASVTLPEGTMPGTEFPFTLQDDDIGFTEITSISASEYLDTIEIGISGSWYLAPRNEAAKFVFDEAVGVDTLAWDIDGDNIERFEAAWSIPGAAVWPTDTFITTGTLRDNFDAVNSENAVFDTAESRTEPSENFEDGWTLPQPFLVLFNEAQRFAHHNYIDGTPVTVAPFTFVIVNETNDRVIINYLDAGTIIPLEFQITPGSYTATEMAAELTSQFGALLNGDTGAVVSADFNVTVRPDGGLRISTTYKPGTPGEGFLQLLLPPQDSAWETLGFTTGTATGRADESENLAVTTATPDDFETEWKSNEDSNFTFPDDPGPDSAAADFGGPATHTPEEFEANWDLILP